MDRPTCGTCKHFVRKGVTVGHCHGGLPVMQTLYAIPNSPDDPEVPEARPVRVVTSWGAHPKILESKPCCAYHQDLNGWWEEYGHIPAPIVEVPFDPDQF